MPKKRESPRNSTGDKDPGSDLLIKKYFKVQNLRNQKHVLTEAKAELLFLEGRTINFNSSEHQFNLPQGDGSSTNVETVEQNIILSPASPGCPTDIQREETVVTTISTVSTVRGDSSSTVGEQSIENEAVDSCEISTESKEKVIVQVGMQDDTVVLIDDNNCRENSVCGSPLQQSPCTTLGDTSTSSMSTIPFRGVGKVEDMNPPLSPRPICMTTEDNDDNDIQIISNNSLTITCGSERLLQDKPRTLLSLEMTNFMGFTYKKVNFCRSTVLNEPVGKSTIIIGLLLALGQDDILKFYGYKLIDVIKMGESIAVLKLEAIIKEQAFGESIVVSKKVFVKRKIQVDSGGLLPTVWKLKTASSFVPVVEHKFLNYVVPHFKILKWKTGIPIIINPLIISECINRPFKFWYKELKTIEQGIPNQKEIGLENLIMDLENKRRCLKEKQELHNSKFQSVEFASMSRDLLADIVTDKDAIIKLQLCMKRGEESLDYLKAFVKEKQSKLNENFISRYRALSATMGLKGDCVIDTVSEEIIFAVWPKLAVSNGSQLKQQFAVSSLKYKSLALVVLITCFWEEMTEPTFFVVDAKQLLEDRLLNSTEFKKLMDNRPLQQFIFG